MLVLNPPLLWYGGRAGCESTLGGHPVQHYRQLVSSLLPLGTLGKHSVSELFWLSLCYWGDPLRRVFLGIPTVPTCVHAVRGCWSPESVLWVLVCSGSAYFLSSSPTERLSSGPLGSLSFSGSGWLAWNANFASWAWHRTFYTNTTQCWWENTPH